MLDFMPDSFCESYLEFEERHLPVLWESLLFLPITRVMCQADPDLAADHEA